MNNDITILRAPWPGREELSVAVREQSVGISIWDNDDYRVVWFNLTLPEHRQALQVMLTQLGRQLEAHCGSGQ